jgi:hypothetical protein
MRLPVCRPFSGYIRFDELSMDLQMLSMPLARDSREGSL